MYDTLLFLNGGTETNVLSETQPWIEMWIDRGVTDINAPIFDGSYDWHSSVHGRLAQVINLEETGQANLIVDYANAEFPANLVQAEINYNAQDAYGIAWLFQLDSKLLEYGVSNVSPLADFHYAQLRSRVEARVDSFIASNSINIFGSYGDPNWMIMNAFSWGDSRGNIGVQNWAETTFNRYANTIDWTNIDILQGDFFSSVGIAALTHVTMGQTSGAAWTSVLASLETSIESGRLEALLSAPVAFRDAGALLSLSWGMWAAFSQTQDPAFYRAYEDIIIWAEDNLADWGAAFATSGHWLPNFLAFGLDITTELEVEWSVDLQAQFNDYDGVIDDGFRVDGNVYWGSTGDDLMSGTNANNIFIGGEGDDVMNGNGGGYNQVDYSGALEDFAFTQNANGSVTVTNDTWGTDILVDIDGVWFSGEGAWYSIADAVRLTDDIGGEVGTFRIDGNIYWGSSGDDIMIGTSANNIFIGDLGNDVMDGNGGGYNQVDYSGALADFQLVQNPDGSVTVINATWGTDTLTDIDGLWFGGEGAWYSMADALQLSSDGGVAVVNGVYTGTAGNDVMTGTNANNFFFGGRGDDIINGNGGAYNQVDYDGDFADYAFSQNADGSITVSSAQWGTDTLTDIDGFWFAGEEAWYSIDDIFIV